METDNTVVVMYHTSVILIVTDSTVTAVEVTALWHQLHCQHWSTLVYSSVMYFTGIKYKLLLSQQQHWCWSIVKCHHCSAIVSIKHYYGSDSTLFTNVPSLSHSTHVHKNVCWIQSDSSCGCLQDTSDQIKVSLLPLFKVLLFCYFFPLTRHLAYRPRVHKACIPHALTM